MKKYILWKVTVMRQNREGSYYQEEYVISRHDNLLDAGPDIQEMASAISDKCKVITAERYSIANLAGNREIESEELRKLVSELGEIITWCRKEASESRRIAERHFVSDIPQSFGCYSRADTCDCIRQKIESSIKCVGASAETVDVRPAQQKQNEIQS